jgi:hypothetical protein
MEANQSSDRGLLEQHLHALMRLRAADLLSVQRLTLPALAYPLPSERQAAWFPVVGMYGGFKYWSVGTEERPQLMCESWSRVEEGSG